MKILTYFLPFICKAKAFPRLLFLCGIVACWFGGALSAYANDGSCHAIYSDSANGSASLHVPCVVLDSTSDDTVYEFDLNQVSGDEPLSFAIVNRKPTTGAVSGAKATFNEATGVFFMPLVEVRHAAGQVEHYAVQMKTVSPANETRLVVSSKTLLTSTSNNPSTRKKEDNVAVCHIPSGNPAAAHTIYISMNAYENAHKKHGDTLGECGSSSADNQGGTGTDGSDNTGGDGTGTDGTNNTGSDGTGTDLVSVSYEDSLGNTVVAYTHEVCEPDKISITENVNPSSLPDSFPFLTNKFIEIIYPPNCQWRTAIKIHYVTKPYRVLVFEKDTGRPTETAFDDSQQGLVEVRATPDEDGKITFALAGEY